jgi:hypothetical protein
VNVVEWSRALDARIIEWCCSASMVWVQISVPLDLKLYLRYYLGSVAYLEGRGVEIFESRSDGNISTALSRKYNLRSSGTDMLYGCLLLRRLYNILYFLWLNNEFFIILYNILKIAELDCCQIIILGDGNISTALSCQSATDSK